MNSGTVELRHARRDDRGRITGLTTEDNKPWPTDLNYRLKDEDGEVFYAELVSVNTRTTSGSKVRLTFEE